MAGSLVVQLWQTGLLTGQQSCSIFINTMDVKNIVEGHWYVCRQTFNRNNLIVWTVTFFNITFKNKYSIQENPCKKVNVKKIWDTCKEFIIFTSSAYKVVLTAAHCLTKYWKVEVLAGTKDLTDDKGIVWVFQMYV